MKIPANPAIPSTSVSRQAAVDSAVRRDRMANTVKGALARTTAVLLLASASGSVLAQDFPSRALKWVVPSAPGDGADVMGRIFSDRLSQALGQAVIIDNKPGAGGVLASEMVAKSPADGYTMIIGNAGSHGVNAAIYSKLRYDVAKDFVPVALFCTAPNVMVVSQLNGSKTVAEFAALAKSRPGKLNYASGGVGSSAHMSAELFKSMAGVEITHVPYKGGTPAVLAVLSGEVDVMIGNLPPFVQQIKAGKVKALAVTTANRHPSMPDVPALAETYPGFETVAWYGLFAPSGTPAPIVERLNGLVNAAIAQPDVSARMIAAGCDPQPGTAAAFAARVQSDVARWRKLAAERQIHAD